MVCGSVGVGVFHNFRHYRSVRTCFLALVLMALGHAQPAFQNLTPNFDGSGVWFSSPLRMKDTAQYPHPKMFQWDEINGVRLYDQKPPTLVDVFAGSWGSTTAYNLFSVSASADGGTVAVNGLLDCHWGTPCEISVERHRTEVRRGGVEILKGNGAASLSPNGRFVYLTSSFLPPLAARADRMIDLASGQEVNLNGATATLPYRHRVANDGAVVVTGSQSRPVGLYLRSWPSGELSQLPPASSQVMINASATRLAYAGSTGPVLYDIPTAREIVLASVPSPFLFDISNDGSVAAYLDSGQAWTVRFDGSGKKRVTDDADMIAEMALSGDGNFLFAVTGASRILRIDLRSGAFREIVPATSILRPFPLAAASSGAILGGLYELTTQFLPEIAEVRLAGRSQPILSQNAGDVLVQVPWNMEEGAGWTELVLRQQAQSPFVAKRALADPHSDFCLCAWLVPPPGSPYRCAA